MNGKPTKKQAVAQYTKALRLCRLGAPQDGRLSLSDIRIAISELRDCLAMASVLYDAQALDNEIEIENRIEAKI